MSNKTLLQVITEAVDKADSIERLEEEANAAATEALKLIKPEFRGDFVRFVDHLHVPDAKFLAYWESDQDCQKAMKMAFEPMIKMIEEMSGAAKSIANWGSSDLQSA